MQSNVGAVRLLERMNNGGRSTMLRMLRIATLTLAALTFAAAGAQNSGGIDQRNVQWQNIYGYGPSNFNLATGGKPVAPCPIFTAPRRTDLDLWRRHQVGFDQSNNLLLNGYRRGYYQYDPKFRDNWFWFKRYCYTPVIQACVCSPWYYYAQLPPYLVLGDVMIVGAPIEPYYGQSYGYGSSLDDGTASNPQLDASLDNLVRAFRQHDASRIDPLVSPSGQVAIFMDGSYSYSLRSGDFQDMLHDAISDVRTVAYRVLDVRGADDGTVKVEAEHDAQDPWGQSQTVYHTFRLVNERGTFVIREFGTSSRRL